MNARINTPLRIAAVAGVVSVIAAAVVTPADAADGNGDVSVVNTETVQVYTSATGEPQTRRVYEQLSLLGQGTVTLTNPISTDHARNLDGFSGVDIKNGKQVVSTTVDGKKNLRSVSDYDGKLPLSVSVAYKLDGKNVKPADVVGKDGKLEVQYTVENITGTPQEVSYPDGKGGTVTKTVDVPIPMVGSLSLVAPPSFENVTSGAANLAGDGKGGTKLSFTMTLFPPLGSTTAVFGYTADITDGVVPRAEISALPINPLKSPTFAGAATSYKGGADTGAKLADGATTIDANLLKLRDGAGDLLAGLIKLRDGAGQLNEGLAGQAAPGSQKLADGATTLNDGLAGEAAPGSKKLAAGAGKLDSGLGQINSGAKRLAAGTGELLAGTGPLADGVGKLNDGAHQLSDGAGALSVGTGDALAGSKKLTGGLAQISGGLSALADASTGLPKAKNGIAALQAGVAQILAGLGDPTNDTTLIGGLTKLAAGLGTAQAGAGQLEGGLTLLKGNGSQQTPGLVAAKGGVDQVQAGLGEAVKPGGSVDQLIGGLTALRDVIPACTNDLTCKGTAAALLTGALASKTDLTNANAGLLQVSGGLGQALTALTTQLIPGSTQLKNGIADAKTGADKLTTGAQAAKGGLQQVSAGLDQLAVGVTTAVAGVSQLSSGSASAYTGSQDLTVGLGKIDTGASQLSTGAGTLAAGTDDLKAGGSKLVAGVGKLDAGAGKLAAGTGDAKDGSAQLAAGATKLADGLVAAADGSGLLAVGAKTLASGLQDAADGSGQLVGGLGQAADGAPKIVDGAQQLSDQGTKKLIEAGTTTAQSYGEMYATITAGAKRGSTENMAFGAPADAVGMTAYSYIIKGDDGEGGRNLARGVGGLAILGAGGAVFALRRRLV